MIDTELDYVATTDEGDMNWPFVKVVDAETGDEIVAVTEANAIDGWIRRYDGSRKERFIDDNGRVANRPVIVREDRKIAILWLPETPASQRSHQHRMKPQDQG